MTAPITYHGIPIPWDNRNAPSTVLDTGFGYVALRASPEALLSSGEYEVHPEPHQALRAMGVLVLRGKGGKTIKMQAAKGPT